MMKKYSNKINNEKKRGRENHSGDNIQNDNFYSPDNLDGEIKESIFAKKELGQNFLKSQKVLNQIIEGAGDLKDKTVLEIGPGMGSLTERLVNTSAKKIILIEMDDRLIPILQEKFASEIKTKRVDIIHADILKVDLNSLGLKKGEYSLIANIPYYITGAIIRNVIGGNIYPHRAVVLVQIEVAERIVSRDKKESILSIAVKAIGTPKIIDKVPKGAFVPSPKVDSAILLIDQISKKMFEEGITEHSGEEDSIDNGSSTEAGKNELKSIEKEKRFFDILHAGFSHKRKLLRSNLKEHGIFIDAEKALAQCNIKTDARAEILTVEQWKALSYLGIL